MQKRKQILTVIILTLILSLTAAVTIMAAPESLHLSIVTDATQVRTGDVLTVTYQLVNSDIFTRDVIFYAEIPIGSQFRTVENATPITYTTGLLREDGSMLPPSDVRAITWHGAFTGPRIITLTVDILDQPGSITAKAALVDNVTHITEMIVSQDIFRVYQVTYMPLIFKNTTSGGGTLVPPTPTPSPTPSPTPAPTVTPPVTGDVLTPTTMIGMQSEDVDYAIALQGGASAGAETWGSCASPPLPIQHLEQYWNPVPFSDYGTYSIERVGDVFDTRSYTNINTATLTISVVDAENGGLTTPEDVQLVIEAAPMMSTIDCGFSLPEPQYVTEAVWGGSTPTGISVVIDVRSNTYPFTSTVSLPPELLSPGDYSYLRIRQHREGVAPPIYHYGDPGQYADYIDVSNIFLTIDGN